MVNVKKDICNYLEKIENDDIEIILNIAFISILSDKKSRSRKKLSNIIEIAKENEIEFLDINSEQYNLKDLLNQEIIHEIKSTDILDMLVLLASNIEFFDTQVELESLLAQYRTDIIDCGNSQIYKKNNKMTYTAKDNAYQYYNTEEQSEAEIYANIAWLSNKLAHIFEEAQNFKFIKIKRSQIDLKKVFMQIKNYAIHKVIEEKQKCSEIRLGIDRDNSKNSLKNYEEFISIVIPHYLQPILLHFHKNEISKEERKVCTDREICEIYNGGISALFPLKLTAEKEELILYLAEKVYKNSVKQSSPHIIRALWFAENNSILHENKTVSEEIQKRKDIQSLITQLGEINSLIIEKGEELKDKKKELDELINTSDKIYKEIREKYE